MSPVTTVEEREARAPAAGRPRRLVGVLAAVMAVALLAAGAALAVATGIGSSRAPGEASVDAGFARDMSSHHAQAVQMAQVVRDRGTDPEVRLVAYDIETQQLNQIGQMRGWLQTWGLTGQSDVPPMAWMAGGHSRQPGELMPGMATTVELTRLHPLTGRALDVYFLQLMIRHHRGGLEMAQDAAAHASQPYVRDLATKIAQAQQAEVVTMEQMLRERGGQPLS
ncbi:MAG: DUF305 domain-containing protein [Gaiellaceae bacterium]